MATSMFGTYVQEGQLLVYPFAEWYTDKNLEYKPSDFGYGAALDYRGSYEASEQLIFVSYGVSRNLALELEGAIIRAELEKSTSDPSAMPEEVKEAGLGDVEGQIRWRWRAESVRGPEAFSYFETVLPLQRSRKLIGTQDWEFKFGTGLTRGFAWGTMTVRAAFEYTRAERKFDWGEYAVEYLRRLGSQWRVATILEGNQLDEVALVTEAQWHFHPRAYVKINNGFGLTENATDFAPELGIMLAF
jgi:hypothetical protein